MLIVFKLTGLSRSCFNKAADGEFLDLYLKKRIQERYVYKEPCVLKEKLKAE